MKEWEWDILHIKDFDNQKISNGSTGYHHELCLFGVPITYAQSGT